MKNPKEVKKNKNNNSDEDYKDDYNGEEEINFT